MKLNRLDTHDRLQHFKQDQSDNIFQGADDCMKKNELSLALQAKSPYIYLFAHPRTHDDTIAIKRMIWQPRLTKPKAQTNSYLFRAQSHTDLLEIIWLLPPEELWEQYEKGKMLVYEDIMVSIKNFLNHREELEKPHKDDFPDEMVRKIYREIANEQGI